MITNLEAEAIAQRLSAAIAAAGSTPTQLHVEETPQGLLLRAWINGVEAAAVVPVGQTATWDDVANDLLTEAQRGRMDALMRGRI